MKNLNEINKLRTRISSLELSQCIFGINNSNQRVIRDAKKQLQILEAEND